MRTSRNHRLFPVVLSLFLGWGLVAPGRTAADRGPATLPAVGVGDPAFNSRQAAAGTRQVQAPPLQVPADVPSPGNPVVVVSTSLGDITLELFKERAPVSVENFLAYVNEGFYTDTVFHRVRKGS
jgi:hypothetical protein